MIDRLDQIFVLLKHWILGYLPGGWQTPVGVLLSVVCIIGLYPALFALTTVLERKGLGRMQNRLGPNRVGPFGILQPIADGIKSLTKEDIVPTSADARGAFSGAGGAGGRGVHGLCGAAHGPQHGAGGYGRRPAVLLRDGSVDRSFRYSWRGGRAATSIRCWARCARWRR